MWPWKHRKIVKTMSNDNVTQSKDPRDTLIERLCGLMGLMAPTKGEDLGYIIRAFETLQRSTKERGLQNLLDANARETNKNLWAEVAKALNLNPTNSLYDIIHYAKSFREHAVYQDETIKARDKTITELSERNANLGKEFREFTDRLIQVFRSAPGSDPKRLLEDIATWRKSYDSVVSALKVKNERFAALEAKMAEAQTLQPKVKELEGKAEAAQKTVTPNSWEVVGPQILEKIGTKLPEGMDPQWALGYIPARLLSTDRINAELREEKAQLRKLNRELEEEVTRMKSRTTDLEQSMVAWEQECSRLNKASNVTRKYLTEALGETGAMLWAEIKDEIVALKKAQDVIGAMNKTKDKEIAKWEHDYKDLEKTVKCILDAQKEISSACGYSCTVTWSAILEHIKAKERCNTAFTKHVRDQLIEALALDTNCTMTVKQLIKLVESMRLYPTSKPAHIDGVRVTELMDWYKYRALIHELCGANFTNFTNVGALNILRDRKAELERLKVQLELERSDTHKVVQQRDEARESYEDLRSTLTEMAQKLWPGANPVPGPKEAK